MILVCTMKSDYLSVDYLRRRGNYTFAHIELLFCNTGVETEFLKNDSK